MSKISNLDLRRPQKKKGKRYAAASFPRTSADWNPVDTDFNSLIQSSSAEIRSRVRQLVRDFPYFKRALQKAVDYIVGPGIVYQARVTMSPAGKLNKQLNQKIEDVAKFWMEQADYSGKLHYYEIMSLAKRQELEAGEYIVVKRVPKNKNRFLPYALQLMEPDWLTESGAIMAQTEAMSTISQGIEYDTTTGEVLAYHFTNPDSWGKPERIPADQVIHGFETVRPNQLRGVSPFVSAVLLAHDLDDYMCAEIDAAKMAAKYLAMVETPDPESRMNALGATTDDDGNKIEELQNAIIEYLRPGEKITLASNPRPGNNFPPFVRLILCMISIATDIPYSILSGDYQNMNYSVGKTERNDFLQSLKTPITRHIRHFCNPTIRPMIDAAVMLGKLKLPQYSTNPWPFYACEWQPPGMESIDPLRESKANISEVQELLRSPQEITRARGREYEDVLNEIAEAKEQAKKRGLTPQEANTALANNPAAVAGQGK